MFEFLFEVIYEFRFTRWILGALAILAIALGGGLASAGGWAATAFVLALALMPDVIEYATDKDK